MFRRFFLSFIALVSLTGASTAYAIAPIISQANGDEANEIMVTLKGNKGEAVALGCKRCPIRAQIDAKTRFYLRGKALQRKDVETLSGQAGTIVYQDGRVIKILWDTGTLN